MRLRDLSSASRARDRVRTCAVHCDIANASRVRGAAVDALRNYENTEPRRLEFPSAYGGVRSSGHQGNIGETDPKPFTRRVR